MADNVQRNGAEVHTKAKRRVDDVRVCGIPRHMMSQILAECAKQRDG